MASSESASAARREMQWPADAVVLAREASVRVGPLTIEPAMRRIKHDDGREAFLQPRVMQVLVALVRAEGEILSRDDMLAQCWGGVVVGEDALNRVMARLRRLSEGPGAGVFRVETITKVGYRLVAEDSAAPATPVAMPAAATASAAKPVAVPAVAALAGPRLAVLAFDNISGDPELAYFSDGVSEEILQTVARGADLKVIGRASSFQFRGPEKAAGKVAAALNATHVLDGSVRRGGARVRVAAQLVECAGESTLWADRFEGDLTDIFALQDQIAEAVARALKVTLTASAPAAPLEPAVYEEFLRARAMITEGSGLFDDVAAETAPVLERVVAAAPAFAAAWALLARARAWILRSGHRQSPYAEGRAGVVEAAETALRLDPRREGAYLALAMLEPWGAYAARERLLKQALEVSPNEPSALTEMSSFCWQVGRFGDALTFAEHACELNPLMPAARLQVAQMRTYVGDYEASVRMHQELRRRWPHNLAILMSLLNTASRLGFWAAYDEAIGGVAGFAGWQGSDLHAAQTYAETLRSNDPAKRAERLRRYAALLEKTGTMPLNLVESLSSFGMSEEAMALAERASFAHMFDPDGPLPSAYFPGVILSRWSELNRSPRFIALCDRLGLCAYWAESGRWPDCAQWTPYDFKAEALARAASPPHPA